MTTSVAAASRLARPPFVSFPRRRIDSLVIAFATAVAPHNTQTKQSNLRVLRRGKKKEKGKNGPPIDESVAHHAPAHSLRYEPLELIEVQLLFLSFISLLPF